LLAERRWRRLDYTIGVEQDRRYPGIWAAANQGASLATDPSTGSARQARSALAETLVQNF
jgi:hypothetical protein